MGRVCLLLLPASQVASGGFGGVEARNVVGYVENAPADSLQTSPDQDEGHASLYGHSGGCDLATDVLAKLTIQRIELPVNQVQPLCHGPIPVDERLDAVAQHALCDLHHAR